MQRLALPSVGFVQINRDLDCHGHQRFYSTLASAIPAKAPARHSKLFDTKLAAIIIHCPCSKYAIVSNAKLEKVVNAPQNPTTISNRHRGSSSTRCVLQIIKNPTMKLPTRLINSVPKGKTGLINFAAQRLISQRELAPKMAPIEMM